MEQNEKLEQKEEMDLKKEDTKVDKYTNGWRNAPFIGPAVGVLGAIIAIAAHLFHVTISHLLFDSNERLDIMGVFQRAYAKGRNGDIQDQNNDTKTEPEAVKGKNEKSVENEKDSETKKIEPQNENSEKNKTEKNISPEERDKTVKDMFNKEDVKEAFRKFGLEPVPMQNSDNIVLFKSEMINHVELQKKVCAMSKDELLNGNADTLATAMFQYQKENKSFANEEAVLTEKTNAALKAAAIVASVNYITKKEDFDKAILENKSLKLATVNIEDKYGASSITMESSSLYKDMVDIKLNGKVISCASISELSDQKVRNNIIDNIITQNQAKQFEIGSKDKLRFIPTDKGIKVMCVDRDSTTLSTGEIIEKKRNVTLGTFKFETENDISRLHQALARNGVVTVFEMPDGSEKTVNMAALAYTCAVINNPDIKPFIGNKGDFLDPMDDNFKKSGASHLYTEHTEHGVQIKMFYPQKDVALSDVMICKYNHLNNLKDKDIVDIADTIKEAHDKCIENNYIQPNYDRMEHESSSYGTKFDDPITVEKEDVEKTVSQSFEESVLNGEEPTINYEDGREEIIKEHSKATVEQDFDEALKDVLDEEMTRDLTPDEIENLKEEVDRQQEQFEEPYYDDDCL